MSSGVDSSAVDVEGIARRYRALANEVLETTAAYSYESNEPLETKLNFRELRQLYALWSENLAGRDISRRFRRVHELILESYTALHVARQYSLGYSDNNITPFDDLMRTFRSHTEVKRPKPTVPSR